PYVMPGFVLARLCAEIFPREKKPATIGMVLLNHGIFSFGENAREAYERMISLVERAEAALAPPPRPAARRANGSALRHDLAQLRRDVSRAANAPMIVASHQDAQSLEFAHRADVGTLATRGPL